MEILISCLVPVGAEPTDFIANLVRLSAKLDSVSKGSFEILILANGRSVAEIRSFELLCGEASEKFSGMGGSLAFHSLPVGVMGKGRALQLGAGLARGKYVVMVDADLPYKLDFIDRALVILQTEATVHLVAANRRLAESRFNVPVPILKLAYARHRLGGIFNRLIRFALPITVTDTQAGMKMMTGFFARGAFESMKSLGFWFDIELFLKLKELGLDYRSLPVELKLRCERSTVKIIRHGISALIGLLQIVYAHYIDGFYRFNAPRLFQTDTAFERFFLWARWKWTPYYRISAYLPIQGKIADLGCGYGLMAMALQTQSKGRTLLAVDHDERRIRKNDLLVKEHGLTNIRFETVSLKTWQSTERFDGISLIDVFHYFSAAEQRRLLANIHTSLSDDGVFVFRELNKVSSARSLISQLHEIVFVKIGFTKADELHFRDEASWKQLARQAGFEVESFPCRSLWFNDYLFICRKVRGDRGHATLINKESVNGTGNAVAKPAKVVVF